MIRNVAISTNFNYYYKTILAYSNIFHIPELKFINYSRKDRSINIKNKKFCHVCTYTRHRYLDVSAEPLTTPQPQELEQSPVVVIISRRFYCSRFIFFSSILSQSSLTTHCLCIYYLLYITQ